MNAHDLKKTGTIATIITFVLLGAWLGFSKISLGAYNEKNLTYQFLKEDSKVFETLVFEVGTDTVARIIAGTSSMTLTGTSSYPYQPRIEYSGATGKWSFKNSGGTETVAFGTVSASYVAAEIGSTAVLKNNGSSTGQLATDATLAGSTTIGTGSTITTGTTTFSGTKVGYLADVTQPIGAYVDTKLTKVGGVNTYIGSITAGGKIGTSSFTFINGSNITSTSVVTANGEMQLTVNASGTLSSAFYDLTGSASASQLPSILELLGTTTAITGTSSNGRLYNLQNNAGQLDSYYKFIVNANTLGTSTFTDSTANGHFFTGYGGTPIGTSTNAKFSGSTMYAGNGSGQYVITDASSDFNFSTGSWTVDFWFAFNTSLGENTNFWKNSGAIQTYLNGGSSGAIHYYLGTSNSGWEIASALAGSKTSYNINQLYHFEESYDGSNYRAYINGTLDRIIPSASSVFGTNTIKIGDFGGTPNTGLYIDDFSVSQGIARHTGDFTPSNGQIGDIYNYYSAQYLPPGTTTPAMLIVDDGTNTTSRYILNNVSRTCFGYGTITAITSTSSSYCAEGVSAALFPAYNVKSFNAIKAGVKSVTGNHLQDIINLNLVTWHPKTQSVNRLDAEHFAKKDYLQDKKQAWKLTNKSNYIINVIETGTGTVTTLDSNSLDKDSGSYAELAWASDLSQGDLVEKKKDYMESDGSITRMGVIESDPTVPEDIKGDDRHSVDLMSAIAKAYKCIQEQQIEIDELKLLLGK